MVRSREVWNEWKGRGGREVLVIVIYRALLDLTNPKWRIHHPTGTPSICTPKNTPAIQARHDINVTLHFGLTDVRTNLND